MKWIASAMLYAVLSVVGLTQVLAADAPKCTTFLDNRGRHLVLHARQREAVDLHAYYVDDQNNIDNATTTTWFDWEVDSKGVSVAGDPLMNGHAKFYGGLEQKVYQVIVTAHAHDGTDCVPAKITIEVELDYESLVSLGVAGGTAYDEFSPGVQSPLRVDYFNIAREFSQFSVPLYVGVYVSRNAYVHPANAPFASCPSADPGCVTSIGSVDPSGRSRLVQTYIPSRAIAENSTQVRFGVKLFDPRIYLAASLLNRSIDYASYGHLRGLGFELEKLPDLDRQTSLFGNVTYYPKSEAHYQSLAGQSIEVQYRLLTYRLGVSETFSYGKWFAELGYEGDQGVVRSNAPANFDHARAFLGLGKHL